MRMQVQKAYLDHMIAHLLQKQSSGLGVEIGLGSGRTYDHLRNYLPDYEIYAFDFKVECHPSCTPPPEYTVLGPAEETFPEWSKQRKGAASFVHCDIGTTDLVRDKAVYEKMLPHILHVTSQNGLVLSDRMLIDSSLLPIPLPGNTEEWPYFLYRINQS